MADDQMEERTIINKININKDDRFKRDNERAKFGDLISVHCEDKLITVKTYLHDASLGGARFESTVSNLEKRDKVGLYLPSNGSEIFLKGEIKWKKKSTSGLTQYGIKFDKLNILDKMKVMRVIKDLKKKNNHDLKSYWQNRLPLAASAMFISSCLFLGGSRIFKTQQNTAARQDVTIQDVTRQDVIRKDTSKEQSEIIKEKEKKVLESSDAYSQRGFIYYQNKEYIKAVIYFRKALEIDETNKAAIQGIDSVWQKLKDKI